MPSVLTLLFLGCIIVSANSQPELRGRRGLSPATPSGGIIKLRLINADTDLPTAGYDALLSNTLIDLNLLSATSFSIEAITVGAVGSVQWDVNGNVYIENNVTRYWSMSDTKGSDSFKSKRLQVGTNITVKATAYSGKQATGTSYPTVSIHLSFYKSSLLTLTVMDAVTDLAIGIDPLLSGCSIDTSITPKIKIRANVSPLLSPRSIRFIVSGADSFSTIDKNAPFFFLENDGGEWTPKPGQYTLSATAFTGRNGRGSPLANVETVLTVTGRSRLDAIK